MPQRPPSAPSVLSGAPSAPRRHVVEDAFALINLQGEYWNGTSWTPSLSRALLFRQEPDPYSDAKAACGQLRAAGHRCHVLYLYAD